MRSCGERTMEFLNGANADPSGIVPAGELRDRAERASTSAADRSEPGQQHRGRFQGGADVGLEMRGRP